MASQRASGGTDAGATPALRGRARLWCGLGLAAAAVLLDLDATLAALAIRPASDAPATLLAGRLAQALLFAAGIAVLRARRPGAGPYPLRAACGAGAALLGMQAAALLSAASRGAPALLMAGAAVALLLLAVGGGAALLLAALGARPRAGGAGPALAVLAVTLVAVLLELLLAAQARRAPPTTTATGPQLALPDALARRDAQVPGAKAAWWWHGHLHVFDAEGRRRTTPLPPKAPGTFRIAAVGDSLTYGYGVAEHEAWPAVLQRELEREYRAEVLNLGVCGVQSEEVLGVLHRVLPRIEADLVLYGVCLNDFLPAGRGVYRNNRAWPVAFPGSQRLEAVTRLGALIAERYDRLLMRLGVRADFMTDILRDFQGYQRRFARDAAEMSRTVAAHGLPPILTLVLTQLPATEGPGARIGAIAEQLLRDAGASVVPADYQRVHDGRVLTVSRWEGHPDAEAHRIFAEEFRAAVVRDPRLAAFRRGAGTAPAR